MSHLKSFDFYSPVLSSDIVKSADLAPSNNESPEISSEFNQETSDNQIFRKKKKHKNKNKNKSIKQQHDELLKKINITIPETQEDIDAWIAERKKKFPTRKRIEEKEQSQQDREERGALDLSQKANKEKRKSRQSDKNSNKPLERPTYMPTKIPSILDKITQDEERKKYSIVLQCFRYFVKHNFLQDKFDPSQKQNDSSYYSDEYYSDTIKDEPNAYNDDNNDNNNNNW